MPKAVDEAEGNDIFIIQAAVSGELLAFFFFFSLKRPPPNRLFINIRRLSVLQAETKLITASVMVQVTSSFAFIHLHYRSTLLKEKAPL